MQFKGQSVGEISQHITFNFRDKTEALSAVASGLLSFAWKHDGNFLKTELATIQPDDPFLVPLILSRLLLESVDTSETLPKAFGSIPHRPLVLTNNTDRITR